MINIVVPMAGMGKSFIEKGYTFPKPLIEIKGKPMIEWVIKNLTPAMEHRFIFICKREHYEKYRLGSLLNLVAPNCQIVVLDSQTAGAACTVLLAKKFINSEDFLLIAGSDQFINAKIDDFLIEAIKSGVDGNIMTFDSTHPKWSFAKVDKNGFVIETSEKNPISNHASVGLYFFKHGKNFVESAESMIKKDIRTNNEFFLCPVYNEMLLSDKKLKTYEIPREKMINWATPEDLESFLKDGEKLNILQ